MVFVIDIALCEQCLKKHWLCLSDFLLDVKVNSYGHVETLALGLEILDLGIYVYNLFQALEKN